MCVKFGIFFLIFNLRAIGLSGKVCIVILVVDIASKRLKYDLGRLFAQKWVKIDKKTANRAPGQVRVLDHNSAILAPISTNLGSKIIYYRSRVRWYTYLTHIVIVEDSGELRRFKAKFCEFSVKIGSQTLIFKK